jgi:tRNA 2-selenouridine synthase
MASDGEMQTLVHELLVQHYDPAYLRSIERNFPQLASGSALELTDISESSFKEAASVLIRHETVMRE